MPPCGWTPRSSVWPAARAVERTARCGTDAHPRLSEGGPGRRLRPQRSVCRRAMDDVAVGGVDYAVTDADRAGVRAGGLVELLGALVIPPGTDWGGGGEGGETLPAPSPQQL